MIRSIFALSMLGSAVFVSAEEYTVEKGLFEQKLSVDGIAVPVDAEPILIEPETWGDFYVDRVLPHGTRVKKGDQLIWIDTEKVEEYIETQELDVQLSSLRLAAAKEELKALKIKTERNLLEAERKYKREMADYAYFKKVELPEYVKSRKFDAERSDWSLDYTKEELIQLKKMYDADGLTEDTEEIILQRAKNSLKSAEYRHEQTVRETERSLETTLPRREEDERLANDRAISAWEYAQTSIPRVLKEKEIDVQKQEIEHARKEVNLAEVKNDFAAMKITAPSDGYFYYGTFKDGQWQRDLAKKTLKRGAKLPTKVAFATIVPENAQVEVVASTSRFVSSKIEIGQEGKLTTQLSQWKNYPCEVVSVASAPNLGGNWSVSVKPNKGEKLNLKAGESVKVNFVAYTNEDALAVPAHAVKDHSDGTFSVQLKGEEGEETTQIVKLGESSNDKVEVLDGLAEGQVILVDAKK